jgi:ankyrin repeat protein
VSQSADINEKNIHGMTPLDMAITGGQNENSIYLQTIGGKKGHDIQKPKLTDICEAIKKNDIDKLKQLVNYGADVNEKTKNGRTSLHYAAKYSTNIDILKYLLLQGAYVNAKDKDNFTPLHYAAQSNSNVVILKYLVSKGADINAKNIEGNTPIDVASGQNENAIYLRNIGGQSEKYIQKFKVIDIFDAIQKDDLDKLRQLIDAGANVNEKNDYGSTPLHYATEITTNIDIFKYLVSQRADINAKNHDDSTPLHYAAKKTMNNVFIMKYLISQGADVNAKDRYGRTPLDRAITDGHIENSIYLRSVGGQSEKNLLAQIFSWFS